MDKAYEDLNKIYIKAGKAHNWITCDHCQGVNHPIEKPKSRKWVCEDCGKSKIEEVE